MEKTFYEGPYEGMYTRKKFLNALRNVPGIKLNGKYDFPPKNGKCGEIGIGLIIGKNINAGRIVHTTRYSIRSNRLKSFFMGPNVYNGAEIKIITKRRVVLDGIEKILNDALSSE